MRHPLPVLIQLWFAADALLAFLLPLHWAASGGAPILGVPRILLYLFASSAFIAASVVAAYLADARARA